MSTRTMRTRGLAVLSINQLEKVLGLKQGSIRGVEYSLEREVLYILHDDEDKGAAQVEDKCEPPPNYIDLSVLSLSLDI